VRRLSSALSSAFGAIALLLAAGGLYGTLLYAASQRRRELGIRIALGAARRRILGDVVAGGVGLALVGLLLGVPSALLLGRFVRSFLYEVAPTDPLAIVAASLVLLVTAALASWLPAYRASRTDPLEVLRAE
jgi:ABC-type antimicrobial peptide transport system permease subunit